jgi:hypothetical protein
MNVNTPSAPRQRKPRSKPARTIGIVLPMNAEGENGIVRITVGKEAAEYMLIELAADYGRGFKVEKMGTEGTESGYHVNVTEDGKKTCDCLGHMQYGRCKHSDGLAALIAAGRL